MAVFNLPSTHDEWFTIQFIIFFLIGFGINVYSNGQATLVFLDNEYSIKPDSPVYNLTEEYKTIQRYTHDTDLKDKRVWYLILVLYWIVSPLVNFYYAIFIFKKGQWKHLNISGTSEIGGNV